MENGYSKKRDRHAVLVEKDTVPDWKADIINWEKGSELHLDGGEVNPGEVDYELRKLVLHFDVRNTVLVADSVTNINVEQALNSYLTGVTWGKDTEEGWQWYSDKASLTCPASDCITYYKHLERELVRVPSDRGTLRRVLGDFTQQTIGEQFLHYYQKHLQLVEWDHNTTDLKLTLTGKDGKLYHYILPAFFKLIQYLHEKKRNFSIIFRTYGMDAPNVLQCLAHSLQGHHPLFDKPIPIKVHTEPGKIHRDYDQIQLEMVADTKSDNSIKTTKIFSTEKGIYNMLNGLQGACAFVDDFTVWQDNNYNHRSGKPFWINTADRHVHHIIFDDNIRVSEEDSIVDVRTWDTPTSKGRSLSMEEAAALENVCLVQADLLESTENHCYFIEKVQECERNYDKFLASHKLNGVVRKK